MNTIIKYLISGGTAALIDLILLHSLDNLHLNYIISVNIAFVFAFVVSFTLQKYWTFNDPHNRGLRQITVYFIVSLVNVFINTILISLILKFFVYDPIFFLKPVVIAQIISGAVVAIESFLIYKFFIFKKKEYNSGGVRILIVTQKLDINDGYFGFFHDWVLRFARNCSKVTVVALEVGEYHLPDNVKVLSLKKGSKIESLKLLWSYSISERNNYDTVFCHMSPVYVITGWLVWTMMDKMVVLWYVHRSVDLKLRLAHLMSRIIFTATPETFRIKSNKVKYMGQSVDLDRFKKPPGGSIEVSPVLKIITVGRVTPIKNLEILIDAAKIIKLNNIPFNISIVGEPVVQSDFKYKDMIVKRIKDGDLMNEVVFLGSISNKDIPSSYWKNDICVNMAPTGGLDKTVLEAMASSMPVVVCNRAFEKHIGIYEDELIFNEGDASDLAKKILEVYVNKSYTKIGEYLRKAVEEKSNLDIMISTIVKELN